MTTRKITTKQFEDGTVLDTSAIDHAIDDTISSLNNIGPDVDTSSMLQKQFIWGMAPPQLATVAVPPAIGVDTAISPFLPVIPLDVGNIPIREERLKSNDPYGITCVPPFPIAGVEYVSGWNWQTSFWTEDPIIITDLDVCMHMQANAAPDPPLYTEPGEFIWFSAQPPPLTNFSPLEDIVVSVTVDNPHNQQDPSQVALTIHKNFFALSSQRIIENDVWTGSDMVPNLGGAYPLSFTRGFNIQAKEVNAPVPGKSRVRINIFVPNYINAGGQTTQNEWKDALDLGLQPWRRFLWSNTLTYLERKAS